MFASQDRHVVNCECIVELYELLWRWSHRCEGRKSFQANFGFSLPDTVVVLGGKPYAWFFVSKKDGALLRKSQGGLSWGAIDKKMCKGDDEQRRCATWLPITSQFLEARCHSKHAEFLTVAGCRDFMAGMRNTSSGILQMFVEPDGVANTLVRTVHFRNQTTLCTRTNRALLNEGKGLLFDRCATFEGWEGLSSSSSRYRNQRHPHMEELILAAGETLSERIEQERVGEMLFLETTQHVALHFKVGRGGVLYFVYGSVVEEKDVILQMRPELLMRDPCMMEELRCVALLPGGTDRKARHGQAPTFMLKDSDALEEEGSFDYLAEGFEEASQMSEELPARNLPPILLPPADGLPPVRLPQSAREPRGGRHGRREESRERVQESHSSAPSVLPLMTTARPVVPAVPYRTHALHHSLEEAGRYDYPPPFLGLQDSILSAKRPLISSNSTTARSRDGSLGGAGSLSARGHLSSARSEPVQGGRGTPGGRRGERPPPAPS